MTIFRFILNSCLQLHLDNMGDAVPIKDSCFFQHTDTFISSTGEHACMQLQDIRLRVLFLARYNCFCFVIKYGLGNAFVIIIIINSSVKCEGFKSKKWLIGQQYT